MTRYKMQFQESKSSREETEEEVEKERSIRSVN
jgi:hypothetical protein